MKAVDKSQPAVLIFHTHTTEGYEMLDRGFYTNSYTGRGEDKVETWCASAMKLQKCSKIRIQSNPRHRNTRQKIHRRIRPLKVNVEAYLKKYPSIQVVLDIHRDAIHLSNGNKIKAYRRDKRQKRRRKS